LDFGLLGAALRQEVFGDSWSLCDSGLDSARLGRETINRIRPAFKS